ncbi:MAG: hypothetical protein AAF517_00570 [Planctomycetota bacterium]
MSSRNSGHFTCDWDRRALGASLRVPEPGQRTIDRTSRTGPDPAELARILVRLLRAVKASE